MNERVREKIEKIIIKNTQADVYRHIEADEIIAIVDHIAALWPKPLDEKEMEKAIKNVLTPYVCSYGSEEEDYILLSNLLDVEKDGQSGKRQIEDIAIEVTRAIAARFCAPETAMVLRFEVTDNNGNKETIDLAWDKDEGIPGEDGILEHIESLIPCKCHTGEHADQCECEPMWENGKVRLIGAAPVERVCVWSSPKKGWLRKTGCGKQVNQIGDYCPFCGGKIKIEVTE